MIALSVANVFAGKRNFSLNKAKKEKKHFCGKPGSMLTFRSTRNGKKCFFVMSLRMSDHKMSHNISSSSSFFRFRSEFLAFLALFRTSNFFSLRNLIKTIIPFALVGYETGYSQLGATRLVGYFPSHIQRALI